MKEKSSHNWNNTCLEGSSSKPIEALSTTDRLITQLLPPYLFAFVQLQVSGASASEKQNIQNIPFRIGSCRVGSGRIGSDRVGSQL